MDKIEDKDLPLILPADECSNDEYHNGFGNAFLGSSTLGMLDRMTPLEVLLDTFTESEATKVGSAFHLLMESEKKFKEEIIFAGKDGRSKEYKDAVKNAEKGTIVLNQGWLAKIEGMRTSITSNKAILELIEHHSVKHEMSAFVRHKPTTLGLKCRPDIVRQGIHDSNKDLIIDYKTTKDVNPDSFGRSVFNYSYHIQAALYEMVWEMATGREVENFIFVCVEKERPYLCVAYQLDEDTLAEGRAALKKALVKYKKCAETKIWEGYEQKIHTTGIPRWSFKHTDPKQQGII